MSRLESIRALSRRVMRCFSTAPASRAGGAFDQRIISDIQKSDLFVLLVSPNSVKKPYTKSEIRFAKERFPNPDGRVLPVVVVPLRRGTKLESYDPYFGSLIPLVPASDVAAEVVYAVWKLGRAIEVDSQSLTVTPELLPETLLAYRGLWSLTSVLPRWPRRQDVNYPELQQFSERLRDWYFSLAGGLFLSRPAHHAYSELQEVLTAMMSSHQQGPVSAEHYDHVRELCSALRSQLAAHVGTRK